MGQFGGRDFKKGGGKLDGLMPKGGKGIPDGGSYPGKSSVGKVKSGIDTPTTKGNKGVTMEKGFPKSPAKFDD